jgi:predicted nucleotidyltransferase
MLKSELELVAYASAFSSFIIPKISGIKEIILFGSAARSEATKNSDIDIFIDIENKKDENNARESATRELEKFYKSKMAEMWILKGIKNPIKISIGKLDEWKLKRSVISDGICLYGKYKQMPEKLKGYALFNMNPIRDITKRNRVIRKLFGREEKKYFSEGVLKEISGKKLSASSFMVPIEHMHKIIKMLGQEKINYMFFEMWTDAI